MPTAMGGMWARGDWRCKVRKRASAGRGQDTHFLKRGLREGTEEWHGNGDGSGQLWWL